MKTQNSGPEELAAIQSGTKSFSNQELRILLVMTILNYLEGDGALSTVLTLGSAIHQQTRSHLEPDLLEATSSLAYLAEHAPTTKPHSFTEHQKIEDQLVTIMDKLKK